MLRVKMRKFSSNVQKLQNSTHNIHMTRNTQKRQPYPCGPTYHRAMQNRKVFSFLGHPKKPIDHFFHYTPIGRRRQTTIVRLFLSIEKLPI